MSLRKCYEYILSDCYRFVGGGGRPSVFQVANCYWNDIGFRFTFWFRLCKCRLKVVSLPSRFFCRHLRRKYRIEILWPTEIGYGFRLCHGGPCVINASAVIGDSVDVYQYVTIGSSFFHAAHIGSNVYIGPSVCIVEDVTIGDGATIGAGAVVVRDVPAGATVAGVPAKVVSYKEAGRLVCRKYGFTH